MVAIRHSKKAIAVLVALKNWKSKNLMIYLKERQDEFQIGVCN